MTTTLPPFQRHSETSRDAAIAIHEHRPTQRQLVLDAIRRHPAGLTDEQIVRETGLSPSSARPRRVELERDGLVVASARRGRTSSGRQANVWVAAVVQEKLL